jgi:hypothetical protein
MVHESGGIVLEKPATITAKSVANSGRVRMLTSIANKNASGICTNERYGHYGRTHEESSNSQPRMTS